MKYLLSVILFVGLIGFYACDDEDDVNPEIDYQYHATIHSPDESDKKMGDTLHVHVNFESHTGEIIHHAKVRLVNDIDGSIIFEGPEDKHVHSPESYEFHHNVILSHDNGVTGHSNWTLEASAWGMNKDEGLVTEELKFHVHPH